MPKKITGNYQVFHADNHKTQNNNENDAKVKNVTIKKQTPESKKHYKQDKPFAKMSINKTTPNSYNLVANTSTLMKFKNKIAHKIKNIVAKPSNNQQKSIDNLLKAVDKLDEFYKNFDNVSEDTKNLLKESKDLKSELDKFDQNTKTFEDEYAKELKFIADYKLENDLSKIKRTMLKVPKEPDVPDTPENNFSYLHTHKNTTQTQIQIANKFIEKFTNNTKYNEYILKCKFIETSNKLFKYHNIQMQVEKQNIDQTPSEIKRLDKQIDKNTLKRSPTKIIGDLTTEKKKSQTEYKLYKDINSSFKKLNIHNKSLSDDITDSDKKIKTIQLLKLKSESESELKK